MRVDYDREQGKENENDDVVLYRAIIWRKEVEQLEGICRWNMALGPEEGNLHGHSDREEGRVDNIWSMFVNNVRYGVEELSW